MNSQKALNKPDHFVEFIEDQLTGLRDFKMKRMFGGHGLYLDGVFFGILGDGKLYFKTSAETVQQYLSAGSGPFIYLKKGTRGKKKEVILRRYYQVPVDVLENQVELKRWAKQAAS